MPNEAAEKLALFCSNRLTASRDFSMARYKTIDMDPRFLPDLPLALRSGEGSGVIAVRLYGGGFS
jgi:hypothetical protein